LERGERLVRGENERKEGKGKGLKAVDVGRRGRVENKLIGGGGKRNGKWLSNPTQKK